MTILSSKLARLPLFRQLDPREVEILKQHLRPRRLDPHELLFAEGAPARSCFVLITGQIGVYKRLSDGREERLALLNPGALAGHMALIDQKPRSAACRAESQPALLLELQRAEFDRLFTARSPFAFKILDQVAMDLAERLRSATERLIHAHQEKDATRRRDHTRQAAEALEGFDTSRVDLADIDLDAITYEITDMSRRMRGTGG